MVREREESAGVETRHTNERLQRSTETDARPALLLASNPLNVGKWKRRLTRERTLSTCMDNLDDGVVVEVADVFQLELRPMERMLDPEGGQSI